MNNGHTQQFIFGKNIRNTILHVGQYTEFFVPYCKINNISIQSEYIKYNT